MRTPISRIGTCCARSAASHTRSARSTWRCGKKEDPACIFEHVELERGVDQWKVERQNLVFSWGKRSDETFEVRFGLDPETFEFSIKPVPLAWFYESELRALPGAVRVGGAAQARARVVHRARRRAVLALGQDFHAGSLLADDIATGSNHPELCTWIMDWPNPDDRAFRATARRLRAFERVLEAYWRGAFHPRAIGVLTVENAFLDRGFAPAFEPPAG